MWRKLVALVLLAGVLAAPSAWADDRLEVVASLSTFADLVEQVGGERVKVISVASPKFNEHFIEPRPSDVLKLKRADLFVHGGLDLEAWRDPLVNAAGNPAVRPGGARELNLSHGVMLLEKPEGNVSRAGGDIHLFGNPHYWHSPHNALVMAAAIAAKLSDMDPQNAAAYRQRAESFRDALQSRIDTWQQTNAIQGQAVVAYHNQWPYLTEFLGLRTVAFLEPKPGIPPTPRHLVQVQQAIDEQDVQAILRATYDSERPVRHLTESTSAVEVVLCQGVDAKKVCGDYITMMDYNIDQLNLALQYE